MSDLPKEILAETKFLRMIQAGHWTYVQRPNTTGAIAIVALTDNREIILVKQHRIPVNRTVIELPAGLVGDLEEHADESLITAAERELVEETGYHATNIQVLFDGVSSAGLTDERIHLVLATGLSKVSDGGGDATEDISVHVVSLDNVDAWISEQRQLGYDVDFKVFAGLYYVRTCRKP